MRRSNGDYQRVVQKYSIDSTIRKKLEAIIMNHLVDQEMSIDNVVDMMRKLKKYS